MVLKKTYKKWILAFVFVGLITPTFAQAPAHYDPFFVLPGKKGEKSIVVASLSSDVENLTKTTNSVLMSKFSPGENTEVGAQLNFGFFNDQAKSFSTLAVGGKYRLGKQRAATLTLALPAKDVKDPGISLGFMNTYRIASEFQLNQLISVSGLKGYTSKNSIFVFQGLLEPIYTLNNKWAVLLTTTAVSDSEDISNHLAIDLTPNIDWLVADGNLINIGCSFGLAGSKKNNTTAISISLLRSM